MTLQDTGQTWKFLTGLTVAILLMHVCVVKTLDFRETCIDSQFGYTDWLQHHIKKRDTVKPTTTTTTTTTTKTNYTLQSIHPLSTVLQMSMRINQIFETSLTNKAYPKFKFYEYLIKIAIENSYKKLLNYIQGSVNVIGFRSGSGSIIVDYTITANSSNLDVTAANTELNDTLAAAGIHLPQDAFAETVETILTTKDKLYPLQDVELRCTRPNSVVGTIKWSVNDKDPAGNSAKYTITNNDIGSNLIVKAVSESDNGRYSCIIERSTLPYIQWQTVSIEPLPNIYLDKTYIQLQCKDQTVELTCCANGYPVEWSGIPDDDEVINSASGFGCITLQHKILSTNCGSKEIFTCRLKDMPELQTFYYSSRTVQVKTVREYDCINDMLGVGKIGDSVTGLCEKGLEGFITYECKQTADLKGVWTVVQRNTVVQAIKDLERRSEVLFVDEIPEFMTDLSNTAVQSNTAITKSADTVKTIVDILNTIASISQTITVSQPVMEGFFVMVFGTLSDRKVRESLPTKLLLQNLSSNGTRSNNPESELSQRINVSSIYDARSVSSYSSSNSSTASHIFMNR